MTSYLMVALAHQLLSQINAPLPFAESFEEQVISSVKLRRCISTAIDDESEVLRMRGYLICVDQRPADGMIDSIRI